VDVKRAVLLATILACDPKPTAAPTTAPAVEAGPAVEPASVEAGPGVAQAPADASTGLPAGPVFAAGPFEVKVGKGKVSPPTKAFDHPPSEEMMLDHVWASGWTEDGGAFAYCTHGAGADCAGCLFTSPGGASERFESGEDCEPPDDKKKRLSKKGMKQLLVDRKVAIRDGTWAHGGDLIVTSREVRGAPDSGGDARGILKVGAARRDGSAAGEAHEVSTCSKGKDGTYCLIEAHAELIALSPDGGTVAILGHTWGGEWSDTFELTFMPAGRLAAASYNKQGLDALARQDFNGAAAAFLAATHADEATWKGPYNLACAYARGGDARAQAALTTAVSRGGEAVRKRAATDKDLDSVRALAWFAALMKPA
jgi:hypothetical protein